MRINRLKVLKGPQRLLRIEVSLEVYYEFEVEKELSILNEVVNALIFKQHGLNLELPIYLLNKRIEEFRKRMVTMEFATMEILVWKNKPLEIKWNIYEKDDGLEKVKFEYFINKFHAKVL